jgi:hypothetical protein
LALFTPPEKPRLPTSADPPAKREDAESAEFGRSAELAESVPPTEL